MPHSIEGFSDKEVFDEFNRRKQIAEEKEKQRIKELAELNLANIDFWLTVINQHSRTSCNDNTIINGGYYKDGLPKCIRCFLLDCKRDNYWPPEIKIEASLEWN